MDGESTQDRLFGQFLIEGTEDAGKVWVAAGPAGVSRLHSELSGEHRVRIPESVHPKDVLDNLSWASQLIATSYPDQFLSTFGAPEWDGSTFVIAGLGAIRRPEVTERLMRLLAHDDKWVRIQAAFALRGHRHRALEAALLAAHDDPEALVRYHVEERLAELD